MDITNLNINSFVTCIHWVFLHSFFVQILLYLQLTATQI